MIKRCIFLFFCTLFCSCAYYFEEPKSLCRGGPTQILQEIDRDFLSNYIGTESPIFGNNLIKIPTYSYYYDIMYKMHGDSLNFELKNLGITCELINTISVTSNEPRFEWENSGDNLVAAAVFTKRIKLNQELNRIQNVDDIVWVWHSGLKTGGVSSNKQIVNFKDGRKVINGKIIDEVAVPLEENNVYVWAVWAWNEEGTKIIKSSMEIPFIVKGYISFSIPQQLSGKWELDKAINLRNKQDMKNKLLEINVLNIWTNNCYEEKDAGNYININGTGSFIENSEIILSGDFILTDIKLKCNSFSGIIKNNDSLIEVEYDFSY